jgi:hypothetical protein
LGQNTLPQLICGRLLAFVLSLPLEMFFLIHTVGTVLTVMRSAIHFQLFFSLASFLKLDVSIGMHLWLGHLNFLQLHCKMLYCLGYKGEVLNEQNDLVVQVVVN